MDCCTGAKKKHGKRKESMKRQNEKKGKRGRKEAEHLILSLDQLSGIICHLN